MKKIKQKSLEERDAEIKAIKKKVLDNQKLLFKSRAMERDIEILKGMKEEQESCGGQLSMTILNKALNWIETNKSNFLKNNKVINSLY